MYELNKSDYRAILDLVTSLVNVKSINAFSEMLVNSKELLEFDHLIMSELIFHKTCTQKIVFSDEHSLKLHLEYTFTQDHFDNDKVLSAILNGQEVIKALNPPIYISDLLVDNVSKEKKEMFLTANYHVFAKMNKETMTANNIVFMNNTQKGSEKFDAIVGYLYAHLMSTFVRIMSVRDENYEKLSERELSVMTWLKHGKTSWEVAKILDITENTVNFHIKNIKRKLNATNRQHAVAIAIAKGILE